MLGPSLDVRCTGTVTWGSTKLRRSFRVGQIWACFLLQVFVVATETTKKSRVPVQAFMYIMLFQLVSRDILQVKPCSSSSTLEFCWPQILQRILIKTQADYPKDNHLASEPCKSPRVQGSSSLLLTDLGDGKHPACNLISLACS